MRKRYGKTYRIAWRRRREGKTDYHARYRMLLSRRLRVVVRKSLRHIVIQFVKAEISGDKTLSYTHSQELKKYGWKYNCGNLPAAYLTGYLAGLKAKKKGISDGILDIGPQRSIYGGRLYVALRGLIDAGIDIPHNPDIFPSETRIMGQHIAEYAKLLAAKDQTLYKKQFGFYLKNKLKPEKITENFIQTLKRIAETFNADLPNWIEPGE